MIVLLKSFIGHRKKIWWCFRHFANHYSSLGMYTLLLEECLHISVEEKSCCKFFFGRWVNSTLVKVFLSLNQLEYRRRIKYASCMHEMFFS